MGKPFSGLQLVPMRTAYSTASAVGMVFAMVFLQLFGHIRSVQAGRRIERSFGSTAWARLGAGAQPFLRGQRDLLDFEDDHGHQAVTTATHPDVGLDHLFVPLKRECHPNCTKRGNCNAEEGRCECPFGYAGPTCEDSLLPGCQHGPLMEASWGSMVPRNCECVRQAFKFFGCTENADTCTLASIAYHDINCYTYLNRAPSEQYSVAPLYNDSTVRFYSGSMAWGVQLREIPAVEGVVGRDIWSTPYLILPPERCGETRCHGRGSCIVRLLNANEETVRAASIDSPGAYCQCFKGFVGHTCSEELSDVVLCPNNCSSRGQCLRGFCHCQPPYWGLDCSRERAWQLAPAAVPVPNRQVLRIYVYDLPSEVSFPIPLDDNVPDVNEAFYQTHKIFLELLLRDGSVRTENPWEANLFYLPANAYAYSSNTNPPEKQLASVVRYVANHYPWFNASGGRDHVVFTTGDRGICYVSRNLSNLIHITQFGLYASQYDNHTTFLRPLPTHHPGYGCFHPKKDVLAAPWYDHLVGSAEAPALYDKVVADDGDAPGRDLLFFFAGSVRPHDTSYSGGARQALNNHLKQLLSSGNGNYSDVLFLEGYTRDYEQLFRRSTFCLAPHGAGFGVRLTLAMTHACVPVIIQDMVYQPYESDGVLPYGEFSLRLGRADIPHIVPILRSVSSERLRRMRLAMAKYYKAFVWDPKLNGRAYNYTIRALRHRLNGLWGRLWGENDAARRHQRLLQQQQRRSDCRGENRQ